jgi:hypothetical protein
MKWVRLSERHPETTDWKHFRIKRGNEYMPVCGSFDCWEEDAVEWLDESEPETIMDINNEALADLRNKMSPALNLATIIKAKGWEYMPELNKIRAMRLLRSEARKVIKVIKEITKT